MSAKSVLAAIKDLHKFEKREAKGKDLKAVLTETKRALTNYQAELLASILKSGKGKNIEGLVGLTATLQTAIKICNNGALMLDLPASPSPRTIAIYVTTEGDFWEIEAFLKALRSKSQ